MNRYNRKHILKANLRRLVPCDLLWWDFIEASKTGTPCEKLIAEALLAKDPTMDRTIYRVTDNRFEEGERDFR